MLVRLWRLNPQTNRTLGELGPAGRSRDVAAMLLQIGLDSVPASWHRVKVVKPSQGGLPVGHGVLNLFLQIPGVN